MKRVLIIAGPARQRATKGGELSPALQRYHNAEFQMLRELQQKGTQMPEIIILSAKYGWIRPETPIKQYVKQMNEERVDLVYPKLKKQWDSKIAPLLIGADFVHLHMSDPYRYALARMGFFIEIQPTIAHVTESYKGMLLDPLARWCQGFLVKFPPDPLPLEPLPPTLKTVSEMAQTSP